MNKFLNILLAVLIFTPISIQAAIPEERYHDYRAQYLAIDTLKMQQFHLQQAQTKLINNQPANAWGDLAYLLCHVPNHHEALMQMAELAPALNKQDEMGKFFEKAIKTFPDDAIVYALYGSYLYKNGDPNNGAQQIKLALEIDPNVPSKYLPQHVGNTATNLR